MTTNDDSAASNRGAAATGGRCPVCRAAIQPDEERTTCEACNAEYHAECWAYNNGCAVYGCSEAATTEGLDNIEIPAAFWGQEEKSCPVCNATILAAAMRCRNCGTTFQTAKPRNHDEYLQEHESTRRLQRLRKTSIWLLVLGLLPCTAPFVAVGGLIWYLANRSDIRRLPGTPAMICQVGIGAACLQTVVMIFFTAIYPLFSG